MAVAAAIGVAVLGTAGAFGYRAMSSAGSSSQVPVIKADAMPTKVAPAAPAADAQPTKQIYDRVGERGSAITDALGSLSYALNVSAALLALGAILAACQRKVGPKQSMP